MGGRVLRAAAVGLALGAMLPACAPLVRNHGYVPTEGDLAALRIGVDTPESVIAAVGRPTTGGVLGISAFYYVQSRFQQFGIVDREVAREVLAISFAPNGTLGNIERFGLQDGRVVALSRRTTDEIFADTTFVRQILGNIGRVDAGTLLGEE